MVASMSQKAPDTTTTKPSPTTSAQGDSSSILTPTSSSTSATPPQRSSGSVPISTLRSELQYKMDEKSKDHTAAASDRQEAEEPTTVSDDAVSSLPKKSKTNKCVNTKHKKKAKAAKRKSLGKGKKASRDESSSESTSSEDESESDEDEESSDSSSEGELVRKKKAKSKPTKKLKAKQRKRKQVKKQESSSESQESSSEESETVSEDETPRKKKSKKKSKVSEVESDDSESASDRKNDVDQQIVELMGKIAELQTASKSRSKHKRSNTKKASKSKSAKKHAVTEAMAFKRVDWLWDSAIHNYKLKESAEDEDGDFMEFAFLVKRKFDWEGQYSSTVVDIKSKPLRSVLAEVMKDCKSVSLETEEPTIDPNLLFLYLEDLRTYYRKTLKKQIASEKKKKNIKKLQQKRSLTKTLCKYIDEDYADVKKNLYPLLESGNITFDLLWALFTPNDIAVTSCYGSWDEPRCFKVDYAMKYCTMTRGEWYCVEGKYLEYDGKAWGFGDFEVDIDSFKGPRKITSLTSYPLKYHSNPEAVKKQIIARGQRFVAMQPQEYKFHKGLAFMKKKKQVLKININGRVMIDPATFRRINPNYPISFIKPDESEELVSVSDDDDDDDCSCCDSDDEEAVGGGDAVLENADAAEGQEPRYKYKLVKCDSGVRFVAVEVDENGDPIRSQQLNTIDNLELKKRSYSEEELLLTSPVVLGFAFSEKLWLEFSLSGVHDITYNDQAFSSLVLPGDQKSTVHALVKSHKFHAAKTIDDVVQGKGRGLVFVLHGPPGTGKTLTAEGISELLRCPLYCVSAGELGTDPARLETELQKVLDIAHSWGALLLLDEADVFLEKRQVTDLHRNALVSIFLRLLEYFQGILFLTTNRVETFDDAFQSRIHVALRYDELTPRAKKEVWRNFIKMVREQPGGKVAEFNEEDFTTLSRHRLNGRQIKNTVRTAQALALNENEELTMIHIKRVLDVAETFDRDLKGGIGYTDAMRSYT